MSEESNITVVSNIFVRKRDNVEDDPEFAHNVSGQSRLKKLSYVLHGSSTQLTSVQKNEMGEDTTCRHAKNGEMTHGKCRANGELVWACRCENTDCTQYEECMDTPHAKRIVRAMETEAIAEPETQTDLLSEYLGVNLSDEAQTEDIFSEPVLDEMDLTEEEEEVPEEIEQEERPAKAPGSSSLTGKNNLLDEREFLGDVKQYQPLDDPSVIIKSPIDSKILVNAGPGTGKTYTAIERLRHIIQNEMALCEKILVLCYTNAAKDVITERLESGHKEGKLPSEARLVRIHTFDSLASYYLLDSIEEEITGLNYNQRIERFNSTIKPDNFDDFEYVIIDELQDLVNQRARMVLKILENIRCGFLLLGDKCQAIYDYDCRDKINAVKSDEFYRQLEEFLGGAEKYELRGNRRQSQALTRSSESMRKALLTMEARKANKAIADALKEWPSSGLVVEKIDNITAPSENHQTAVLCRNNGEAEYVSSIFRSKKILHTLLRGATIQPLSVDRWCADMFWDYVKPDIDREDFVERYASRVKEDETEAEERFGQILQMCDLEGNSIKMDVLRKRLAYLSDAPHWLKCPEAPGLVVSTIHKAKGREFDRVYILDSFKEDADDTEEARVRYVAATRPKKELEVIKSRKLYYKRLPSGRVLSTVAICRNYKTLKFCERLVVGLAGDVDAVDFVDQADPIGLQKYISKKIQPGDALEIRREQDNKYHIYHKDRAVGYLSAAAEKDFWEAVKVTDISRNIPSKLEDVRVSNIVTMTMGCFSENIPLLFRESKLWLGIEITGFAKTLFR